MTLVLGLHSGADSFVIPSRQDNLPNTGLEAHACGTPVVAFNTGGLPNIVDDRVTGFLAKPFESASLAEAIRWVLEDSQRLKQLGVAARSRAERLWNSKRIAAMCTKRHWQLKGHDLNVSYSIHLLELQLTDSDCLNTLVR